MPSPIGVTPAGSISPAQLLAETRLQALISILGVSDDVARVALQTTGAAQYADALAMLAGSHFRRTGQKLQGTAATDEAVVAILRDAKMSEEQIETVLSTPAGRAEVRIAASMQAIVQSTAEYQFMKSKGYGPTESTIKMLRSPAELNQVQQEMKQGNAKAPAPAPQVDSAQFSNEPFKRPVWW